ncbi:MAG: hypothetical protein QOJ91_2273 [Sphingomonadales bacterium]|nr:hypothetical protein [Sphingomonadales bacterium]
MGAVDWLSSHHLLEFVGVVLSLASYFIAIAALWAAVRQLRPLRRSLEQIAAEQRRVRRIRGKLHPPRRKRDVRGFDPRFANSDWDRFLQAHLPQQANARTQKIQMRLDRRYREFHDWYRTTGTRTIKSGVVIIDLLYVPEFLERGYIAPLSYLAIEQMMSRRAEAYGIPIKPSLVDLIGNLCSDQGGQLGALPLWINSHGRFIPDPQLFGENHRLTAASSFDQLLDRPDSIEVFCEASIQSSYLAFEFWAHLAYRGCRLITVARHPPVTATGRKAAGVLISTVLSSRSEHTAFCKAVADLTTRLRFSSLTRDTFLNAKSELDFLQEHAFRLGHLGDARLIREGAALWKPVFSSELLWKALPQRDSEPAARLADETSFRPPFVCRHGIDDWSYLSAIGGYGIALPKAAYRDRESRRTLETIFLANPSLCHPYLLDMLPEDSGTHTQSWIGRHARPQLAFWRPIEAKLDELLFDLFLLLSRSLPELGGPATPRSFWNFAVREMDGKRARQLLRHFLDDVQEIASQSDWTLAERRY